MIMIMIMIIITEDFIVKASSWIKYNPAGLLASAIMLFAKAGKKTTKAKATNKMHSKVIKIHDNNSKRKQILVQSKSKIQKHSYLPRINLC